MRSSAVLSYLSAAVKGSYTILFYSLHPPSRPPLLPSLLFSSLILFMQIAQMEFPQEAELEGRQRGGRRRRGIPGRHSRGGERCQPCAVAVSGGAAAPETFPVSGRGGTGGYFVNLYSFTPSVLFYHSKCKASLHSTVHGLNVKATICCMDPPKMSPHECAMRLRGKDGRVS